MKATSFGERTVGAGGLLEPGAGGVLEQTLAHGVMVKQRPTSERMVGS
jgi:hypothetical protein